MFDTRFLRPRYVLYRIGRYIREERELRAWKQQGKPCPPPHLVKQRAVKDHARRHSIDTLVETGTYTGSMLYAMQDGFRRIFSIELDEALYRDAKQRFAKFGHVEITQGDSGAVLPQILGRIHEPCLFWLDGHYSGGVTARGPEETPVLRELHHIFRHPVTEHVVLIDDARCFVGENDYPSVEELRQVVAAHRPHWTFEVRDDIIRAHGSPGRRGR